MDPAEEGLLIPIAQVMPLYISRLGQQTDTLLIENKKFVQDLARFFDGQRAAKPEGMVTIPAADGSTPIMIAGMGQCEAAEMEDIALEAIEKAEAQTKKTGAAIDFAAERERRGAASAESFSDRVKEYFQARADQGRRNFRTGANTPMAELGLTRGQSMIVSPGMPGKE